MRIYYSGIELEVNQLQVFDRTPVYTDDQVDYLYTKFTIRAIGLVSSGQIKQVLNGNLSQFSPYHSVPPSVTLEATTPAAGMSYAPSTTGSSLPPSAYTQDFPHEIVKTAASTPIITDRAVRHWLSVPRRKLIVTNHSPTAPQLLLESPKPGRFCDAKNGPFVDVFSIQMATGDPMMFLVGLQITTFVNECEENKQSYGAFISNRFSQIHDINEDGYLVINTTGKAYFRTDLVYNLMNPDTLRQFLCTPIPNGFHRTNIKISGNPDVTGMQYSYIDTQQHSQFVVGDEVGATRMEGTYRCGVAQPGGGLETLLGGIERFYQNQFNKKNTSREPEQRAAPPAVNVTNNYYGGRAAPPAATKPNPRSASASSVTGGKPPNLKG